ncbi:hypothetical protein SELMODRAFT_427781 [Selaginella moellendorffii]|uniref:Uncharacterized protein n=1 Tax=Selaginella moellendorffii TaxID=88036 RepID=D8T0P3_SELML|nr:hypothetical protein SELMODRAFT_427781 [Selaginella moellendorffii]
MSGQQAKQRSIVEVDLRVSAVLIRDMSGQQLHAVAKQRRIVEVDLRVSGGLPFPSRTGATSEGNTVLRPGFYNVAAESIVKNVLQQAVQLQTFSTIVSFWDVMLPSTLNPNPNLVASKSLTRRLPVWQELDWMEVRIETTRSQHRPGSPSQPRAHCPLKGNAQRQDTVKFDNHFVDTRVMSLKLRKLVNIEKLSHLKMYYIFKQISRHLL